MQDAKGFKKAVTIFIDILGSRDRQDFSEWYRIMDIFHNTVLNEKDYDEQHPHTLYKREIHIFSDCAYIIYDFKSGVEEGKKDVFELMTIACYNTEKVLFEFLRNNFITRGAITYGDIYYDTERNIWFGPSMNKAFALESKEASFPRVIIDPAYADELETHNAKKYEQVWFNGKILKRDSDNYLFLNYLNSFKLGIDYDKNKNLTKNILDLCEFEIQKHKNSPDELQESIKSKYNWLKKYISDSDPLK